MKKVNFLGLSLEEFDSEEEMRRNEEMLGISNQQTKDSLKNLLMALACPKNSNINLVPKKNKN